MGSGIRTSRSFLAFALGAALVFGVSGTSATAEPASAAPSVLTIISGSVLVRHPQADFAPAHDGDALAIGDTVRTEADSRAVLTMFEGSTVALEPGTEITIDDASKRADSTIVLFTQLLGRTWHVVTHLLTVDSRYNVRTPAATASVRGTAFEVAVSEAGTTTVTTTNGAVATLDAAGTAEVLVTPATTTTVRPGASPSTPHTAPAPDRVVTVSVSGANAIVTDPLGRSNGARNGKIIAQTPGATVSVSGGIVSVSMPNLPDGQVSTRVEGSANSTATVTTTVTAKGATPSTTRADVTVGPGGSATTTTDVKGESQKDPAGRPASDNGKGGASASANDQNAASPSSDQKAASPSSEQKPSPSNDQKASPTGEQKAGDQKPAEARSDTSSKSADDSKPAADASTTDKHSKPDTSDKQSKPDTSDTQDKKGKAEAPQPPPTKEARGKPH